MDTATLSDRLKRIYDLRRANNVHIRKQRLEEIYNAIPEYKRLDDALPDIAMAQVKSFFGKHDVSDTDASTKDSSGSFENKLDDIENCKKLLLAKNGYSEDYLDPVYSCPDCKDTGYTGTERCHCYKTEFMKIIHETSGLNRLTDIHNFSNFDIEYYPDYYIEEGADSTPRDNIRRILNACKEFITHFDDTPDNLLIYGHSGVGKTFLTHCIAGELIKNGHSVIYLTSYQLFDILETKVFRSGELSDMESGILSMLYDCDLLIIDDLGTERINKFTEVQLFALIQERLNGRHSTIISTNLSFDDINNNYSERIFSRLMGNYRLIKLIGNDIRITKAIKENGGRK